ncbi:uncharacterized protein At1g76660-like isoform X1 [Silene latifolia]|uniref:uncharacterized protein At1g76660-like isoform X1 n=2 Tax=Silene latifolia TaxID=37657 RepID=UPI003D77F983
MGSEQTRFQHPERRRKWGGCWGGLPCFRVQKSGTRIAPATRAPDGNCSINQSNGVQGVVNQATSLAPHLLAPPSSPASFSNSGIPSTAQSPNCHQSLSANSTGCPTPIMYATGPYSNETQLVTPPVFSTFTTEPSTAPFTPPPELAHLTTPSSPDVPFAKFLSSKSAGKVNYVGSHDLQATYPYSPESPASSLRSPISRTPGDCASPWDSSHSPKPGNYTRNGSGWRAENGAKSHDSNFFCPATFAQFYLDQPHSVGRLSVSKDSDVYPSGGTINPSKQNKNSKQDVEEVEAYRASFGFSADEMITTSQYVEIADVMDDSFTMNPCTSTKSQVEETPLLGWGHGGSRSRMPGCYSPGQKPAKSVSSNRSEENEPDEHPGNASNQRAPKNIVLTDDEDIFSGMGKSRKNRKYHMGQSCSDAEIEYRRGRSLREYGDLSWH